MHIFNQLKIILILLTWQFFPITKRHFSVCLCARTCWYDLIFFYFWRFPQKGITIHSSILVWRIPWIEEPGRPLYMELQRVRHDWVTFTFTSKIASVQVRNWPGISLLKGNVKMQILFCWCPVLKGNVKMQTLFCWLPCNQREKSQR